MKIAVLDRNTVTTGDVSMKPLENFGEVRYFDTLKQEEIASAISDSDCVIVNKANITADIMDKCPNLKFIGLFATGYNNIEIEEAKKRGIVVCNVPGYSTDSVTQHTFSLILHFASRVDEYAASVARGDWENSETFSYLSYPTTELAGKTLGVFGYGTIGKAVAAVGRAFGMKIMAVAHSKKEDPGVTFVDAPTLFKEADYLTFHCPLTKETKGIVNKDTLALMKKTAVLINTARGPVVVEEDLADALNKGVIRGAGIDVLDIEPMRKNHPYMHAKNCYITPHVAWASTEARIRLIGIVCDNLSAFEKGAPIHVVNP